MLKENTENEKTEEKIIIVKVPPFYDKKLSYVENYWKFNDFLFPEETLQKNRPKNKIQTSRGLPNDDSLLHISTDGQGNIKLNMIEQGNISDTRQLQITLEKLFEERKEMGVYEPGSQKIVKAVGIRAENSVKYAGFFKLVEAAEQSGAEPIILRFDDDAETLKAHLDSTSR